MPTDSSVPSSNPPRAARLARTTTLHGHTLSDDYHWLCEKDDPQVRAYLEAENTYTAAIMRPTEKFQDALYHEMLARIKETDMGVPYRYGPYEYYSRTQAGDDYPIYCRRPRGDLQSEQVLLDLNELAQGHEFLSLGASSVTPDAALLAYSIDVTGYREYTLYVKDLVRATLRPVQIEKVRSIAFANDSATLFYVIEDDSKRAYRLYRHRLGSSEHTLIFEETDPRFSIGVQRSRSRGYIFLGSHSATTSEVRFLSADDPQAPFRLVAARAPDHEYDVDHRGNLFYIVTNDRGRNFRLVTAPVGAPDPANWTEMIPHREEVMLEDIDLFARHAVVHERAGGFPRMRVISFLTAQEHEIEMPEPVYSAFGTGNAEFDTDLFRFSYESLVTPGSVFDYDVNTRNRTLLKQEEILGGYDAALYRSELLYASAADGERIPVSLVYRRAGHEPQKPQPLLLTGYGAYGFASDVHFSSTRLSLLDRGVIYAVAHIRGGGEMGKKWHDEGRMLNKKNTFTDFIAVAELLVAQRYTGPAQMVIEGGSAGGLLVGAVTNLRPDLFKAVVAEVPFVDVVNTMLDANLPLTTGEYEEWGNPQDPEYLAYMLSYSPYDNIQARDYPAMLVETSLNDSQVMYWEPAKYVAKLRAVKTDHNPVLLKTNMGAGHGGASGRYEYLREIAFTYTFILWQLGLAP